MIYLEEDVGSFVNLTYLNNPSFYRGFCIIALIVFVYSVGFSYLYFPRRLIRQKRVMLRVLRKKKGIMESDSFHSVFNLHTEGQHPLSGLIAEYTGYRLVDDVDQYLVRKHRNHMTTHQHLMCYLLSGTLIYACFIPIYLISTHWNNSFVHYLKTECLYDVNAPNNVEATGIDINSLCSPSTAADVDPFVFYLSKQYGDWDAVGTQYCFVNRQEFKVRRPLSDCWCPRDCCCEDARNRCGRGCGCCTNNYCCGHCFCQWANSCGFCWCGIAICYIGIAYFAWCGGICSAQCNDKYKINLKKKWDVDQVDEEAVELQVLSQTSTSNSPSTTLETRLISQE